MDDGYCGFVVQRDEYAVSALDFLQHWTLHCRTDLDCASGKNERHQTGEKTNDRMQNRRRDLDSAGPDAQSPVILIGYM